jgi:hypothetical protein
MEADESFYGNIYDRYIRSLCIVVVSFLTARFLGEAIATSTDKWAHTMSRQWMRAVIMTFLAVGILFLICFLDSLY